MKLLLPAISAFFLILILFSKGFLAMDYLDYDQQTALEELKNLVQHELYRDFMMYDTYLLRWLKVNDFNVEQTAHRLIASIEWRKRHDIDKILSEDFSSIDNEMQFSMSSFDKEGRPVIWAPFGSYDIRKIAIAGIEAKYQRYMIRMYELAEFYLSQLTSSRNVTQLVAIYDLMKFNLKTGGCLKCLSMIPELVSNYDQNFPLLFYKAFVINTPTLFERAMSVGREFMSENTKATLLMFGFDKATWSKALLDQIPKDQLPFEYGGTMPGQQFKSKKQFMSILSDGLRHDGRRWLGRTSGKEQLNETDWNGSLENVDELQDLKIHGHEFQTKLQLRTTSVPHHHHFRLSEGNSKRHTDTDGEVKHEKYATKWNALTSSAGYTNLHLRLSYFSVCLLLLKRI